MPTYPAGVHSHFLDFPQSIRMVTGQLLAEDSGLFDYGDPVVLRKTPQSGVLQGDLVVGEELPAKRVIYTDTGEDDSFNLKIAYEGWGEFKVKQSGDETYTLDIIKGMALQAGDWDEEKIFRHGIELITKIPTSRDLAGVDAPETISLNIEEAEVDYRTYDFHSDDSNIGAGGSFDGGDAESSQDRHVISQDASPVYNQDGTLDGWVKETTYSDETREVEYHEAESNSLSMN